MTFYSHDYATKVVDWIITDADFQNTLTALLPTGVTLAYYDNPHIGIEMKTPCFAITTMPISIEREAQDEHWFQFEITLEALEDYFDADGKKTVGVEQLNGSVQFQTKRNIEVLAREIIKLIDKNTSGGRFQGICNIKIDKVTIVFTQPGETTELMSAIVTFCVLENIKTLGSFL